MTERPKVVIIGAGFGGLEAAKALARAPVDVTLIDRQNHHCFQPLLYQVATAALSPADVAWPIRHILRKQKNATVLMAEVTGIDIAGRRVLIGSGAIPYDTLVIATGATHSYFGHDEWAAVAPGLKRIEDATRIRRSILLAFEQAELAEDEAERRRLLTFVIVGAGATGVEMAGAIAEIARHTVASDFRRIDPRTARIILLEAGPRVLPALPKSLSDLCAALAHAHGRRCAHGDARDQVRRRRRRSRGRAHRCRHGDLGRRRGGVAGGALARRRARPRRARHRRTRSVGARPPRGVRDWRHRRGARREWQPGARRGARRKADGPLCRAS